MRLMRLIRNEYAVKYRVKDRTIGLNNWHTADKFDDLSEAISCAENIREYMVKVTKTVVVDVWQNFPRQ